MSQNPVSKLLLKTFDGSMSRLIITPKCDLTELELRIE